MPPDHAKYHDAVEYTPVWYEGRISSTIATKITLLRERIEAWSHKHGYGNIDNSEYLFQYSDFYNRLQSMFSAMDMYSCQRVKANLLKRQNKIIEGGMHIDMHDSPFNSLTSVFYMNTNNGYTRLETGEKIESVANRLVTFPTRIKHTGSTNNCDALYRCVININWIKKEQD